MAFLTVLARHKAISTYRLKGQVTLGRSMDCDLYLPDVFISRRHCRFEQRNGSWYVVDADSRNGIWNNGVRQKTWILRPGDTVELGTIVVRFNEGEPDVPSHPAPFGPGVTVAELVETVYALDLRPSDYVKKQKIRTKVWQRRIRSSVARVDECEVPIVIDAEPWKREDWAELDIETQIATAQDEMTDWEPPIFNPNRGSKVSEASTSLNEQLQQEMAAAPMAAPTRKGPVDYRASGAKARRESDSIDEEVERRLGQAPKGASASERQDGSPYLYEGVEILEYTWRDRVKEQVGGWISSSWRFSRRNPAIAVAAVLVIAVLLGLAYKLKPHTGPHYYIPPQANAAEGTPAAP